MPFVQINCWSGRTAEQKARVIAKVTEAVSESMDVQPQHITVVIQEFDKENWGMSGNPASDLMP